MRGGLFCFVRRVGRVWFVQDEAIGCGRLAACRTNEGGSATAAVRSFLLDRSMSQRKQTESSLLNPGRFKLTAALKIRQCSLHPTKMMHCDSQRLIMKAIRTTISLPPEQLQRLQEMADQHGLSLAWLVRQAVNEFLERTEKVGEFHPLNGYQKKDQG